MCDLCVKAKAMPEYADYLEKMLSEDKERMEFTKTMAGQIRSLERSVYTSMNWPVKLTYPMFDARAAYSVPNNYFQNLVLDEERLGNSFAHGAMRSLFFAADGRLVVLSKTVNFHDGKEFFTSFILLHLDKGEYQVTKTAGELKISARVEKPMRNLITGKAEKKKILFAFVNQDVTGKIVSKDQVAESAHFKSVYGKYQGGAQVKAGSMDLEGFAVTVPHFAPHPYLLLLHEKFGFESNRQFQEHVKDYFGAHLGPVERLTEQ